MPNLGCVPFDFKLFGKAVAKARFERGLTLNELASLAEVKVNVIHALERRGGRTRHHNLTQLCKTLELDYKEFET